MVFSMFFLWICRFGWFWVPGEASLAQRAQRSLPLRQAGGCGGPTGLGTAGRGAGGAAGHRLVGARWRRDGEGTHGTDHEATNGQLLLGELGEIQWNQWKSWNQWSSGRSWKQWFYEFGIWEQSCEVSVQGSEHHDPATLCWTYSCPCTQRCEDFRHVKSGFQDTQKDGEMVSWRSRPCRWCRHTYHCFHPHSGQSDLPWNPAYSPYEWETRHRGNSAILCRVLDWRGECYERYEYRCTAKAAAKFSNIVPFWSHGGDSKTFLFGRSGFDCFDSVVLSRTERFGTFGRLGWSDDLPNTCCHQGISWNGWNAWNAWNGWSATSGDFPDGFPSFPSFQTGQMGQDFEWRREFPPQEIQRFRDLGRNGDGDHGPDRSPDSADADAADLRFGGADLSILAPEDARLAGVRAARHREALNI